MGKCKMQSQTSEGFQSSHSKSNEQCAQEEKKRKKQKAKHFCPSFHIIWAKMKEKNSPVSTRRGKS
mgnify:CR=1 FL=1